LTFVIEKYTVLSKAEAEEMRMDWPNSPSWSALAENRVVEVEGRQFTTSVVDCGILVMPTGRLATCDPFACMLKTGNPGVNIPQGKYPVKVTLADVSEEQDGSHIREAYASLILSPAQEIVRKVLAAVAVGQEAPQLEEDQYFGFPVDAGTACFVDEGALEYGMPDPMRWYEDLFDNGTSDGWFARMDDPNQIRAGIANIPLPLATDGANLILFHSGWGDGRFPVIGGYDASGQMVAVHVDCFVIP
jgi:hypothetical protein